MSKLNVILFSLVIAGLNCGSSKLLLQNVRVSEGELCSLKPNFDLIASIYIPSSSKFCAGALITKQWVLTSAQCIDTSNLDGVIVSLGSNFNAHLSEKEQHFSVTKGVRYNEYSESQPYLHDIGLYQLSSLVDLAYTTAGLAKFQESKYFVQRCTLTTVLGWGFKTVNVEGQYLANRMRCLHLNRCGKHECDELCVKIHVMYDNIFCTINRNCAVRKEDIGAPLMCRIPDGFVLIAILSYVDPESQKQNPIALFTLVSRYFTYLHKITNVSIPYESNPSSQTKNHCSTFNILVIVFIILVIHRNSALLYI